MVKSLVAEIAEIAKDTKQLAPEALKKKDGRAAVFPRKGSQSAARPGGARSRRVKHPVKGAKF